MPQDRPKAFKCFEKAAQYGDPSALFWLGHMHRVGDKELHIRTSAAVALEYLNRSADMGHPGAMYYLAQLFRSGDECGIAANTNLFWEYLERAVKLEHADALFCLGDIYLHGTDGKQQDASQALANFRRAAALGQKDALCSLGTVHYHAQEYDKAFQYYEAAATRHSMEAWKNLAELYLLGRGVPQSKETAEAIMLMLSKVAPV